MGFPCGSVVKNLPANAGDARDTGSIPGLEGLLEKEMVTHSSILAWEIPGLGRAPGEEIAYQYSWTSLVAQMVKNLPAMWETWV